MGNIRHKFFLVILGAGNFACHIRKGGGQISDFIFTVNLKFIMHISRGVLLGGFGDPAQGKVNHLREKDQDNHGKQKQNNQHQIGDIQKAVAGCNDIAHGIMDYHITPHLII